MLDPDDRSGLRAAVIPTIPSKDRDFWERKFARESGADLVPTRPLENLVKSPLIRSFVGSSVASYRMADLINDNKIVLVRIGGDGKREKEFLASVIVYDVLTAMRQRRDNLDVNSRAPFFWTRSPTTTSRSGTPSGTPSTSTESSGLECI